METKDMKLTIGHLYPDLFKSVRRQREYCMFDETLYLAGNRSRDNRIQHRRSDRFFKTGYRFAGRRFRQGTGNRV